MILMQLPTYLSAFVDFLNKYFDDKLELNTQDKDTAIRYKKLKSNHHKAQPAAMLYSEIFKPINSKNYNNKNLANKRAYYYGAEGMFLESMKVALDLRNKDTEKNNFYNIKYINPEIRNNDNIYSISISDEDEFKTVLDSNANNLKKLGENIVNGLIPICPFMQNKNSTKNSACTYCPYSDICKKDIKEINIREFVKKS
jgi:ATP-dependent helicase/nuclease subunit B